VAASAATTSSVPVAEGRRTDTTQRPFENNRTCSLEAEQIENSTQIVWKKLRMTLGAVLTVGRGPWPDTYSSSMRMVWTPPATATSRTRGAPFEGTMLMDPLRSR
jgi:hypothetical protein